MFLRLYSYGYLYAVHLFIPLLFINVAQWHIAFYSRTANYLPVCFLIIFGFWPKESGSNGGIN
jgi:hypothetical protein